MACLIGNLIVAPAIGLLSPDGSAASTAFSRQLALLTRCLVGSSQGIDNGGTLPVDGYGPPPSFPHPRLDMPPGHSINFEYVPLVEVLDGTRARNALFPYQKIGDPMSIKIQTSLELLLEPRGPSNAATTSNQSMEDDEF